MFLLLGCIGGGPPPQPLEVVNNTTGSNVHALPHPYVSPGYVESPLSPLSVWFFPGGGVLVKKADVDLVFDPPCGIADELASLGVDDVELLVVSTADQHLVRCADELASRIYVEERAGNGDPSTGLPPLSSREINGVRISVLNAYASGRTPEFSHLVLTISDRNFSVLLTFGAGGAILDALEVPRVNVLQIPCGGALVCSYHPENERLSPMYQAASPDYAVFQDRLEGGLGHILDLYGIQVFDASEHPVRFLYTGREIRVISG